MYASFTRKDDSTRKPIVKKIILNRIQFMRMINFNGPSEALKKKILLCNSTFILIETYATNFIIKFFGFNNCFYD